MSNYGLVLGLLLTVFMCEACGKESPLKEESGSEPVIKLSREFSIKSIRFEAPNDEYDKEYARYLQGYLTEQLLLRGAVFNENGLVISGYAQCKINERSSNGACTVLIESPLYLSATGRASIIADNPSSKNARFEAEEKAAQLLVENLVEVVNQTKYSLDPPPNPQPR